MKCFPIQKKEKENYGNAKKVTRMLHASCMQFWESGWDHEKEFIYMEVVGEMPDDNPEGKPLLL